MAFSTALLGLLEKCVALLLTCISGIKNVIEKKSRPQDIEVMPHPAQESTDEVAVLEENDEYSFAETNKKVFIRRNGNGVIVCSFYFCVKDPSKIKSFLRGLSIADAKRSIHFQKFKSISSGQSKKTPFLEQIFWFQSDNDIISKVTEEYSKNKPEEKADDRYLELKFHINHDKLEPGKAYRVTYAYSIPGLFPIKDGKVDVEEIPYSDYRYSSNMSVMYLAQRLKFAIYFERGIMLKECPSAKLIPLRTPTQPQPPEPIDRPCEYADNIIYKKYLLVVEHPEQYEEISIYWDLHGRKAVPKETPRS